MQLNLLVGLSINSNRTKSKSFGNDCGKNNGDISNRIGNEELIIGEKLVTKEELVTEEEFMIKEKLETEEKLKIEKKIERKDLKSLEWLMST